MPKSICVYSFDANPDIDNFSFRISRDDCERRLAAGYVRFLSPTAVQLNPPPGYSPDQTNQIAAGLFNRAWQPRLSDHYLVWQMRPQSDKSDETDKS